MNTTLLQPDIESSSWFKQWFDSSFYHQLYSNRDEQEAQTFIRNLVQELQPLPGSSILDLGCGSGRHSKALAQAGFNTTGIDLAGSSIRIARQTSLPNLTFYKHDMRLPFGWQRFDYVFNLFTSFGYFKTQAENRKVMSNISNSLKPGGRVLFDYLNVSWSEKRLKPVEVKVIDGIRYDIARWTDDRFFYKKISIRPGEEVTPIEHTEQVAKLMLADFEQLFLTANLSVINVFGDYQLNEFNMEESPRLIILAEKV